MNSISTHFNVHKDIASFPKIYNHLASVHWILLKWSKIGTSYKHIGVNQWLKEVFYNLCQGDIMFLVTLVCLSVFLSVCLLTTLLKNCKSIIKKFFGGDYGARGDTNKWLRFGNNPDYHADCAIRNLVISQQILNGY